MVDAFIDTLELFPRGLVYVGIGVGVLVIGKIIQDLLTPYKINRQLRTKDNVALGLSITGYYLGIVIVFLGAVYHHTSRASALRDSARGWKPVRHPHPLRRPAAPRRPGAGLFDR